MIGSSPRRAKRALTLGVLTAFAFAASAGADGLAGQWLIDGKVAVEIFGCDGADCGRIVWLKFTHPAGERFDHDKRNPNPALRTRQLCGLVILKKLRPAGAGRWRGGVFYNPQDGRTYRVNVQLKGADALSARFFVGLPLLGKTKTLSRFDPAAAPPSC